MRYAGVLKLYIESFLSDGILCISDFLVNLYHQHGISDKKLFLVPSTVDLSRFTKVYEKPVPFRYIGYFGSLSTKRDSINVLINAFSMINTMHPGYYLILGGFCSEIEKATLFELITKQNIQSNVLILEYLSRQEVIQYMQHADILVMTRSDDLESKASYPSKLTEYLSTSRPVISMAVGEIANYLTDGLNVFLVEPNNVQQLADKIDYVLNNFEQSEEIGRAGRKLTETIFSYKMQTTRILSYFKIGVA